MNSDTIRALGCVIKQQLFLQEGAGGGLGPLFVGKGGIRPSYMSCDQNGVQLPSYQRGTTEEVKEIINGKGNTDKRLGFVW